MKVENNNSNIRRKLTESLNSVTSENVSKSKKGQSAGISSDRTSISQEAQILAKATSELKNVPETREAMISELKNQIMEGKYTIQYEELAKILQSILE